VRVPGHGVTEMDRSVAHGALRLAVPRVVIAGLGGDAGKTLVSVGLARCLTRCGQRVAPYKKGPDYIDAAWLGRAAGRPARNLDTFLMPAEGLGTALAPSAGADIALVEGNRGLFDGMDAEGIHSTAALAHLVAAPVVLVVDVTKLTRTAAALVLGCRALDPELVLAGVILNRVATARQEHLIRRAVAEAAGVEVIGALPRLDGATLLPSRHLGLVMPAEHPDAERAIDTAADVVAAHIDIDRLSAVSRCAAPVEFPLEPPPRVSVSDVRIAIVTDSAFSFYYPDNLTALEARGATLVPVSPLADERIPEVDAIVIGGGFPEIHAARIAAANGFLASLRSLGEHGVPIYAECGGLMLLARTLIASGRTHAMAGLLDLVVEQTDSPQGHGYAEGRVSTTNPFFPVGTVLRGHEFHYSRVIGGDDAARCALNLERGVGIGDGCDAVCRRNVWASYLHLHALSGPAWADGLAVAAQTWHASRVAEAASA
jgi:cobyrinic acid a,c-diamide synthase